MHLGQEYMAVYLFIWRWKKLKSVLYNLLFVPFTATNFKTHQRHNYMALKSRCSWNKWVHFFLPRPQLQMTQWLGQHELHNILPSKHKIPLNQSSLFCSPRPEVFSFVSPQNQKANSSPGVRLCTCSHQACCSFCQSCGPQLFLPQILNLQHKCIKMPLAVYMESIA